MQLRAWIFEIAMRSEEVVSLPWHTGSMIRGALGHALKRISCINTLSRDCSVCEVRANCPYFFCFETSGLEEDGNQRDMGHPFVINPLMTEKPGQEICFELVLYGGAIRYLSYFIFAFEQAGRGGFTKNRIPLYLDSVIHQGKEIYDSQSGCIFSGTEFREQTLKIISGNEISVKILSPARIRYQGEFLSRDLHAQGFLNCCFNTLKSMKKWFDEIEIPDYEWFSGMADQLELEWADWQWRKIMRWSNRQRKTVSLGGVTGTLYLRGEAVSKLSPYLCALEMLNIGKNRVFGLGKIECMAGRSEK